MEFDNIPLYLSHPLVLTGLAVTLVGIVLFFTMKKKAVTKDKQIKRKNFKVLIPIAVLAVGVGIAAFGVNEKHTEIQKQANWLTFNEIETEVLENKKTLLQLKELSEKFDEVNSSLSGAVRSEELTLVSKLFPTINIDLDSSVNTEQLAAMVYKTQYAQGMLGSDLVAETQSIIDNLEKIAVEIEALTMIPDTSFTIETRVWDSHHDFMSNLKKFDKSRIGTVYDDMESIRSDFTVIASRCKSFQENLTEFLKSGDDLTQEGLEKMLSLERNTYQLTHDYTMNISFALDKVKKAEVALDLMKRLNE